MRSGYMLRRDQQAAARAEQPCEQCRHPNYLHRELPRVTYSLEDGQIVETPNPRYRALHFHCDKCKCVLVRS
jgi:hypothetical protein